MADETTPSRRSKAADQQTISIDEIKNDEKIAQKMKESGRCVHRQFEKNATEALGIKGWGRLQESAKRAKVSPLEYFLSTLEPKL